MYKHFIITRFNLKLESFSNVDKNNKPVRNDNWLEERFHLFEKFCLPSIEQQSTDKFIWFVLFGTDTPEKYRQRINVYKSKYAFFKPLYLDSGKYEKIILVFNKEMKAYLDDEDKYIITTRIDNDDAFHYQMIEAIQENFVHAEDAFLSFTYGLQVDIKARVLAKMKSDHNHFISRFEKLDNVIQTVITYDHAFVNELTDVIYNNNRTKPMWLEIIHDNNVKNVLDNTSRPLFFTRDLDNFQFSLDISLRNTLIAIINYLRLKTLLFRAIVLKRLGIYTFLRKKLKGKASITST